MRILIAIVIILGACFAVLVGLLSVLHDLLVRTTPRHVPSEFDQRAIGYEESRIFPKVSEDIQ